MAEGFLATIREQREVAQGLSIEANVRLNRMLHMAELIEELAGEPTFDDKDQSRVRVCAQVIHEAAVMAIGEMEQIETACAAMAQALHRETANA